MKLSRSPSLSPEDTSIPAGKDLLSPKEIAWIDSFYMHSHSKYKSLVKEYEKEKNRNRRLKVLQVFPSREH